MAGLFAVGDERMRIAIISAVALLASNATAQTFLDETSKNVDQSKLKGSIARIMKELKDPTSIQIRNLKPSRTSPERLICGEFNAKNSFGGYVGFKLFMSDGEALIWDEPDAISQTALNGSGCR